MLVFRFVLGTSIILKMNGVSDLDWELAFWPFWVTIPGFICMILTVVAIVINTSVNVLLKRSQINDLVGALWLLLLSVGLFLSILMPSLLVVSIFDRGRATLEPGQEPDSQDLWADDIKDNHMNLMPFMLLKYSIAYTLCVLSYSIAFKRRILAYLEYYLYFNLDMVENSSSERDAHSESDKHVVYIKTHNFKSPKFIKKLSSTYFRKSRRPQ